MQFIETLKLRSKLFFLFILITIGLISLGVFGIIHIDSMKKNLDGVYFGSLVPITELDEIMQHYNSTLISGVYRAHRLAASPDETILIIQNSIEQIENRWKNYQSHFKHIEELEYVEYVSLEIEAVNRYFLKISSAAKQGKNLNELNVNILEKKVSFISSVLHKLINYEVRVAHNERSIFLNNYKKTMMLLGLFLALIFVFFWVMIYYVFKMIREDKKLNYVNQKLENSSFTDVLTGLYNKRYFNFLYKNELRHAKKNNWYITFMILKLDSFEQYRDKYGDIEGDRALQRVANILQTILDSSEDYLFKFTGNEFGILLSERDEIRSTELAGEICNLIKAEELKHETSELSEHLTLSVGVVCCIADEALEENILLSRANEMLCEAQESGGDRYIITSNVCEAKAQLVKEEPVA